MTKIVLLSGSVRETSLNRQLVRAVDALLTTRGLETEILDLKDFPLPLYLGQMQPDPMAAKIAEKILSAKAVFISTPEYNGAPPPLIKNLIDWTSLLGTDHFEQPVYAIGSVSPGQMSGIMAMRQLNFLLARLGSTVVPVHLGIGFGKTAFDKHGNLAEEKDRQLAEKMITRLLRELGK